MDRRFKQILMISISSLMIAIAEFSNYRIFSVVEFGMKTALKIHLIDFY